MHEHVHRAIKLVYVGWKKKVNFLQITFATILIASYSEKMDCGPILYDTHSDMAIRIYVYVFQ